MRKIIFSDNHYEDIARSIVRWVTVGSIVGIFLENIILFFSIGGIIGILSTIASLYSKSRNGNC